jgi:acyl-coenzyme A synthetase/AMP-(fatty) acid ligase
MASLPLIVHGDGGIVAWSGAGPVTRAAFLGDVWRLAACLPPGRHILNLCADRYHFSVGLAAAIAAGKVSLLPPATTPGVVRQIKDFAPDVFCLTDGVRQAPDMPCVRYAADGGRAGNACALQDVPAIATTQRVAVLFTSGSTGAPRPHAKTWESLVASAAAEARQFGLPAHSPHAIVGTVPPQHMFGFETTLLMPWQNGFAFSHAHPFYPVDVISALAAVPAPRVLVTSPIHLRALLDSGLRLPELALVVSATAPLSVELAREDESRYNTRLMETYGSTETGQIASRRTTAAPEWELFPGVRFSREAGAAGAMRASGGHVADSVLMSDLIEPLSETRFLLQGRLADMINIAGKRHSLASLNHLLTAIPGVSDGAFYLPEHTDADATPRLAACVVAPGITAPRVLAALREHLDPVFLPRPLLFVEALPRNNTGKLPREALQALFESRAARPQS